MLSVWHSQLNRKNRYNEWQTISDSKIYIYIYMCIKYIYSQPSIAIVSSQENNREHIHFFLTQSKLHVNSYKVAISIVLCEKKNCAVSLPSHACIMQCCGVLSTVYTVLLIYLKYFSNYFIFFSYSTLEVKFTLLTKPIR